MLIVIMSIMMMVGWTLHSYDYDAVNDFKTMSFCERYRGLGETERKRLEHDEDR